MMKADDFMDGFMNKLKADSFADIVKGAMAK